MSTNIRWSNFEPLIAASIYLVGLLVFALDFGGLEATLVVVGLQSLRMFSYSLSSSLLMFGSICFVFLYAAPGLALSTFSDLNSAVYVCLFILFFDFLRVAAVYLSASSMRSPPLRSMRSPNRKTILLVLLMVSSILFPPVFEGTLFSTFSFSIPFVLGVFYFESLLKIGISKRRVTLLACLIIGIVAIYTLFYWHGFGRLLIGVYVLIPLMTLMYYHDIKLRSWHLLPIAPIALFFAAISRYGDTNASNVFVGSAGHHIVLTDGLLLSSPGISSRDWSGFLDQYLLFFLNWFPRSIWDSKPIGVNYTSVDDWYGREGVGADFSVSVGMYGETIYYLGEAFLLGNVILFVTIAATRWGIQKLSNGYALAIVIFDVNLVSYAWGGSATFGSRVWFMVLPVLVVSYFSGRLVLKGDTRKKRGMIKSCDAHVP